MLMAAILSVDQIETICGYGIKFTSDHEQENHLKAISCRTTSHPTSKIPRVVQRSRPIYEEHWKFDFYLLLYASAPVSLTTA